MNQLTSQDILCISGTAWDDHWGTAQQIVSRLAETNRVLFVEYPVSPLSLFAGTSKEKWGRQFRRWYQGYRHGRQLLLTIVSPPPVLPFRYSKVINYLNQMSTLRFIQTAMKKLNFSPSLLITFQPDSGVLVRKVDAYAKIYYCLDEWSESGNWWQPSHEVRDREAELVRETDLIFATSRRLASRLLKAGRPTYFLPNAVDYDLFGQTTHTPLADVVSGLSHPVIGFTGMITPHSFDVDLMAQIAERHPEWTFLIIAKKLTKEPDLTPLERFPNVRFVGFRPMPELPSYLAAMDVCLIPLRQTEWIKSAFSLKLFEYLGAGKPVVATWSDEFVPYGDLIYLSQSYEQFERGIMTALRDDSDALVARRMALARDNTWDQRVSTFSSVTRELLESRQPRAQ